MLVTSLAPAPNMTKADYLLRINSVVAPYSSITFNFIAWLLCLRWTSLSPQKSFHVHRDSSNGLEESGIFGSKLLLNEQWGCWDVFYQKSSNKGHSAQPSSHPTSSTVISRLCHGIWRICPDGDRFNPARKWGERMRSLQSLWNARWTSCVVSPILGAIHCLFLISCLNDITSIASSTT